MGNVRVHPESSLLLLIDLQPNFLKIIDQADRVCDRSLFLAKTAQLLNVPIWATEQYPSRMGSTQESFLSLINHTFGKMEFSAGKNPPFMDVIQSQPQKTVILVGIETHICVSQSALDLLAAGFEVVVCPDAVSSSTPDRHKLGMERMRDAGIVPIHSEAVAYEWMESASHPQFKEFLSVVKGFQV